MDKEQLVKRIEWLDDERRKDKGTITDLQKRLAKLEGQYERSKKKDKELNSQVTRLSVLVDKVDHYDAALEKYRADMKKEMDSRETRTKRREKDAKKRQSNDIDAINKTVEEVREELTTILKVKENMLVIQDNDTRLTKQIAEVQEKLKRVDDLDSEWNQNLRSMADDRRQDEKRAADVQGELSALRKRTDEHRAKLDLVEGGQKKGDSRLTELLEIENERKDAQFEFIEGINRKIDEQDKTWREWNKKFDEINKQSGQLKEYIQDFEETKRAVNNAREAFESITDQIGRRINEITEMQRLGEERFRQEWATFKADDQKRWTNYTLTQEEQHREFRKQLDRLADQSVTIEDNFQEIQDVVQNLSEQTEKLFQTFLTSLGDWLGENERFVGSVR